MDSKEYWDKKIIDWEDSTRTAEGVSFIERLGARFRGPLGARSRIAFEALDPFVHGKTVLELGCGSGYFAMELFDRCKLAHLTGIDLSSRAIERAAVLAKEPGVEKHCTFLEGDAASTAGYETDITIGLGLLDYLSPEELTKLFTEMKSPHFLFSFAERRPMLMRYIHILYMRSQRCPKHFYYTENTMRGYIGERFEGVQFVRAPDLSFGCVVHNIPR